MHPSIVFSSKYEDRLHNRSILLHLRINKSPESQMKTYLEIKVPISYNDSWFAELRRVLKDIPVHWQYDFYHITMVFLDDTKNLPEVEAIMHKYIDNANSVNITFTKLDVFRANNGMQIVHLTTDCIPSDFQEMVNDIRHDICCTSTSINSDFRLHVTLGRITESEADMNDIGFLIDEIDFVPFTLNLNEVEYRVFRGRSIFKRKLN